MNVRAVRSRTISGFRTTAAASTSAMPSASRRSSSPRSAKTTRQPYRRGRKIWRATDFSLLLMRRQGRVWTRQPVQKRQVGRYALWGRKYTASHLGGQVGPHLVLEGLAGRDPRTARPSPAPRLPERAVGAAASTARRAAAPRPRPRP